jgi:pilus assembly protein CpaC
VSGQLALPTDGYRAPTDVQRQLEGKTFTGTSGPVSVQSAPPAGAGGGAAAAPGFKL